MSSETVRANIEGMHCAACSTRIERVVGNMEGVNSCNVNLATGKARFDFDPSLIEFDQIAQTISNLGFTALTEAEAESRDENKASDAEILAEMRRNLILMFIPAMFIMVLSMGHMVGIHPPGILHPDTAPFNYALTQLLLVLPVVWLGRTFYLSGIPALFRGGPNMDSLIAIGTGAALVYSLWNFTEISLGLNPVERAHDLYFESAAMLLALVSLGKFLEARSKAKTTDAIRQLMQLTPDTALVVNGDEVVETAVEAIRIGDKLLIRPGARVPVDGEIVDGESGIDESMLTGESMPVMKRVGDAVFGGTLNKQGALTMVARKVGRDTMLSRIVHLVQEAQGSKAPIAHLADRISFYFVPVVICIALIAGLSWYFLGGAEFTFALRIFIAVMVIACPCAMGLATPTSIMVGTGRGAQLGVLVKTGSVLELAQNVSCVVFDKTGTLTVGTPEVTDIILYGDLEEERILRLAAGAEERSEHPLGEAVIAAARQRKLTPASVQAFTPSQGKGIEATLELEGESYSLFLGNQHFLKEKNVEGLNDAVVEKSLALADEGKTVLFLGVNNSVTALLAIADPLKDEAYAAVAALKKMGLKVVMLTGDNARTANAVAARAGIGEPIAEVLPDQKERQIRLLQERGEIVAMVGDGINDAPALARADVGIAMGTGIDVAIESADIVLMNGQLSGVRRAIGLSRATMRNIRQNLFWAFAYNVIGIPVAAGVLAVFGGPTLNPMIGGAAMAMSSVSVVSNALRLRWYSPDNEK